MSRTVAEMVHKLTETGKTFTSTKTLAPALEAMAKKAEVTIIRSARTVVPDLNLSGVGVKGSRIGTKHVIGTRTAVVRAVGQWQFIEYDTKPHIITSKGLEGTRKSRQEAVAAKRSLKIKRGAKFSRLGTPFGPRFYVKHPGTKGQHPWRKGVANAVPLLPEVAARVYRQQLARIYP